MVAARHDSVGTESCITRFVMPKRAEDIFAPSILRIAALLASSISGTLLDAAVAAPPGINPDSGSEALLSRRVVIPLKVVNGFFPDITLLPRRVNASGSRFHAFPR